MSRARATTFSGNQTKKNKGLPNAFLNNLAETSNTKIDENFYKRVIELENEIQLSQNPSTTSIEELIKLYEKGIESFTESHSRQKVNYFKNKLTKLLIGYNKIKKKQEDNKKPTSWSKFMNAHKKNKNKFMLFLNVETSKKEASNILDNREQKISSGYNQITKDLEEQNKKFQERKKGKKKMNMEKKGGEDKNEIIEKENELDGDGEKKIYTSVSNKLRGRNDKVDSSLNDFMKKLHYIYVHSKIFETPIEALNEILEQIFLHKINKYYYYQDQIKSFELMMKDSEKEGEEHDEGIEFLIKDLQNERKSYYMSLETLIDKIRNRIKEKCSETSNDDKNVKKYLDELMSNISKIFIK
jgi:hypothetical protein